MNPPLPPPAICCPSCGKRILAEGVLTARVVRLGENESRAKCARCRTWVTVPLVLAPRTMSR
ncbi:MAG TPA: hypothetical protein VFL78_10710 [Rhodanobacteraceae bacterium]|nr:hypothetical protein [Rhodanobacteraceae bacterium]